MASGGNVQQHALAGVAGPVGRRLASLGITARADVDAFWQLARVRDGIDRDQTIVGGTGSVNQFAVLLEGVACISSRHADGSRQIHAFRYPGDFFGFDGFLFARSAEPDDVQALARCSIGMIDRDALEQAIERHPALGRALWRAALVDMRILRQRKVVGRRPEPQRVAHLLCELLARLGLDGGVIPLAPTDIADTTGLSVVNVNQIFQELRQVGVLSERHPLEVVSKERLQEISAFDGRYLDFGGPSSRWDLRIDE